MHPARSQRRDSIRARVLNTRALGIAVAAVVALAAVLLMVSESSDASERGESAGLLRTGSNQLAVKDSFSHAWTRNGEESSETLRRGADSSAVDHDHRVGRRGSSNLVRENSTSSAFVTAQGAESDAKSIRSEEPAAAQAGWLAGHPSRGQSGPDASQQSDAKAYHRITGRVVAIERGPIQSALVQIARVSDAGFVIPDEARVTHSAPDGTFSLVADGSRAQLLRATHPDYATCFRPVGERGENVILRLAPPATLHVTVLNADNTPARGATIHWRLPYRSQPAALSATSDELGNASFALGIGDAGTLTATSAAGTATATASINVARSDASVTMHLAPTGSLRIRVRNVDGDPIAAASAAVSASGKESRQLTSSDGIADFDRIPQDGSATVSVRAEGYVPLAISVSSPSGQLELTLIGSGPLVGSVTDGTSSLPVLDAQVAVRFQVGDGESSYQAQTAADGRFSLPLLGWHSNHTSALLTVSADGYALHTVEIDFNRPRQPLAIALEPHPYVRQLRFLGPLGTPVQDGEISLRSASAMAARPVRQRLGADGTARVSFATLGAWHVGVAHADGIAHFEILVDAAFCEQGEPHVLTLPVGAPITVVLREPLGELSQQGFVALLDERRGHVMLEKRTDSSGRVHFLGIAPGEYRLLCMNVDNSCRYETMITVGGEAMSLPVTLVVGR